MSWNGVKNKVNNNPKNPIRIDQIKLEINTETKYCIAVINKDAKNKRINKEKMLDKGNSKMDIFGTVTMCDNNQAPRILKNKNVAIESKLAIKIVANFEK